VNLAYSSQSAVLPAERHLLLSLKSTIQGQLPSSELLGRSQKFLRPAESNSEQQPTSFMYECFSHAESQVRQRIHL